MSKYFPEGNEELIAPEILNSKRTVIGERCSEAELRVIRERQLTEPYAQLRRILDVAYEQAAYGKGAQRHGRSGAPWHEQKIIRGQEQFGVGGALFQASKKLEEAMNLEPSHAIHEILGAIVYAAGAVYYLETYNRHSNLKTK